jgi:hypothetical protein
MKKLLIPFYLFLVCASCQLNNVNEQLPVLTSIVIHSPDTGKNEILYRNVNNLNSELNLSQLDKGVDSFELRIWNDGIFTENNLYILKYGKSGMIATNIKYQTRYPKPNEKVYDTTSPDITSLIIDSFITKRIFSVVNSNLILDTIKSFQLDTIPSQNQIPNFSDNIVDGFSFTIELATKHSYSILHYHCPEYYASKGEINNKKIEKFLLFFQRTFKTSFFWCYFHS